MYLCCVLSRGKNKGLENKRNAAAQRAEKHRNRDDRKRDQRARQLIATQKQIHTMQSQKKTVAIKGLVAKAGMLGDGLLDSQRQYAASMALRILKESEPAHQASRDPWIHKIFGACACVSPPGLALWNTRRQSA